MSRYPQDDFSAPVGDWIMNTVRRNPEGLLVLAAGCALLMRGGSAKTSGFSTNGSHLRRNCWPRLGRHNSLRRR